MSTKRTAVELVSAYAIAGTEAIDLRLDLMLLGLEPRELGIPI